MLRAGSGRWQSPSTGWLDTGSVSVPVKRRSSPTAPRDVAPTGSPSARAGWSRHFARPRM